MPLFKRDRDLGLFHAINKELVIKIVDTRIAIFKINLLDTDINIYGEGLEKVYFPGIRVAALIDHIDPEYETDDFGPDYSQTLQIRFHRNTLKVAGVYPEVGDIIEWNSNYYELTSAMEDQIIGGQQDPQHNWSIICDAVIVRDSVTRLKEIKRAIAATEDSAFKL